MSLKDQLKKKTQENNDYHGKLRSDPSINFHNGSTNQNDNNSRDKEIVGTAKPSPKPKATLTDSDWTQLLSTPNPPTTSAVNRGNGAPGIRGLRKGGKKQGSVGSNSSLSEIKRNQSGNSVSKSARRAGVVEGNKLNRKSSDGDESGLLDSARRSSNVDLQGDSKYLEGRALDSKEAGMRPVVKPKEKDNEETGGAFDFKGSPQAVTDSNTPKTMSVSGKVDGVSDMKKKMGNVRDRLRSTVMRKKESNAASGSSTSDDLKRDFSMSDGSFDSDSGSTSDSEVEREREERKRRREKILAEKAAEKAAEVIKERENMVARLEGEKQSLEKILEEQVKQQAQEVKLPALR